jgi:hypothetical protein
MSQIWIPNTSAELDSDDTLSDSRGYINDALEALRSSWSGTGTPSSPVAGQLFYSTDSKLLCIYDGASWYAIGSVTSNRLGLLPRSAGASFPLTGDLYVGNAYLKQVATPVDSTDGANKYYVDTYALLKTGGTLTGGIAMGANDITMDHNPTLATHLARKAYVDLFLPLAGGTMAGNIAMGGYKLTGLAAGTAGSNDSCRMAEFTAALDPSTGHDHDGSDSKKVLAANLDTTGSAADIVVTANGSGGVTLRSFLPITGAAIAHETVLTNAGYSTVCTTGNMALASGRKVLVVVSGFGVATSTGEGSFKIQRIAGGTTDIVAAVAMHGGWCGYAYIDTTAGAATHNYRLVATWSTAEGGTLHNASICAFEVQ